MIQQPLAGCLRVYANVKADMEQWVPLLCVWVCGYGFACTWSSAIDWPPIQGGFLPDIQCSSNRLQIHHGQRLQNLNKGMNKFNTNSVQFKLSLTHLYVLTDAARDKYNMWRSKQVQKIRARHAWTSYMNSTHSGQTGENGVTLYPLPCLILV